MKRIGFILACLFSLAYSLYAMPNHSDIKKAYDNLDKSRIIARMKTSINGMYDYQKKRYLSRFNEGLSKYSMTFVLHTSLDLKRYINTGEVLMKPEDSIIPYDILFSDNNEIKTVLVSYKGEVSYVDNSYVVFAKGYAKKCNRLLKRILREKPQYILTCDEFPCVFIVIDNQQVRVSDVISGTDYLLEDYLNLYTSVKETVYNNAQSVSTRSSTIPPIAFADNEGNTLLLYKDSVFFRLNNRGGLSFDLFYGEGDLIWETCRKRANLRLFNNCIDTRSMTVLTTKSDGGYPVFTIRRFDDSPIESALIELFDHNGYLLFIGRTDNEGKVFINEDAASKCFKIQIECDGFDWQKEMFFDSGTNVLFRCDIHYPYSAMNSGLRLGIRRSDNTITFYYNKIKYVLHKSQCNDAAISAIIYELP